MSLQIRTTNKIFIFEEYAVIYNTEELIIVNLTNYKLEKSITLPKNTASDKNLFLKTVKILGYFNSKLIFFDFGEKSFFHIKI